MELDDEWLRGVKRGRPELPSSRRKKRVNLMLDPDVVARLNDAGIRTHLRKADQYSGDILTPLGLPGCVRVSLCHYNSLAEVRQFLAVMKEITSHPDM